jgi:hypothetical protein
MLCKIFHFPLAFPPTSRLSYIPLLAGITGM